MSELMDRLELVLEHDVVAHARRLVLLIEASGLPVNTIERELGEITFHLRGPGWPNRGCSISCYSKGQRCLTLWVPLGEGAEGYSLYDLSDEGMIATAKRWRDGEQEFVRVLLERHECNGDLFAIRLQGEWQIRDGATGVVLRTAASRDEVEGLLRK